MSLHVSTAVYAYALFWLVAAAAASNGTDISAVYYDAASKRPLPMLVLGLAKVKLWQKSSIGFRSNGCTCQDLICGCCLGLNLQQFGFQREGCLNFTYTPDDFAITMGMHMNDDLLFSNKISAKNPPPLCIPLPVPYLPVVDFCAKLFDVFTPGQNLHMCLDFETRIERAPVLVLHFDCMRMGMDGVAVVKPGDPGIPITTTSTTTEMVTDSDVYDEVTEIKYKKEPA